jgi:2,4-dienoyl-CoA reductase-like NADH-dependent reductase (Old Yellow Enzyme family)/thioredoxin reductase
MKLKNRIVSTPHVNNFGENGMYTEREVYYQREKAKGGAGLLHSGVQVVDPSMAYLMRGQIVPNLDDSIIPWYQKVAEAIHEYGAKYVAELGHEGAVWSARAFPEAKPPVAASPIADDIHKEVPREIALEELEKIAMLFGQAAARCKAGGCDGVIIHAGHGELLMSFYSPLFNARNDEFAGSIENHLRPLFMVIDEVRKNIGRDMALGVRISGDEFMEGGVTIVESKAVAQLIDKRGKVDWIDVSSGNDGNWLSLGMHYGSMYVPPGAMVPLAAGIREVVSIPVSAVGRINDPVQAEKILANGHADLVGMTRALIADPHMPNKAKAGKLEDIRHCVGAVEGCIGRMPTGASISCIQNPVISREKEWAELKPALVKKKVMVIGGGPAGLEAARVSALRGHQVSLYEKNSELGGQVTIASKVASRQELSSIIRWLALQVQKAGVDIKLNTAVTPDLVAKEKPDAAVVATGSIPARLSIPGATDQNFMDERSILTGKATAGQRVVVLDGTGCSKSCSTAEFLADQGKQVFLVAKGFQVGENLDIITKPLAYRNLLEKGVVLVPFTWIKAISDKDVITYNTLTFQEDSIENIDTVVHAVGAVANNQLLKELKNKAKEIYAVGDCAAPRRIENAIYEGSQVGREL